MMWKHFLPRIRKTIAGLSSLPLLLLLLPGFGCVMPPKQFSVKTADSGILLGTQPTKQADFELLRQKGVRTVLSLQCLPWNVRHSERLARANGMNFRHVAIPAWPLEPSERQVKRAVLTLHDKSLRPIFLHCYLGHDRAALIVGLYRIYYDNWTPDEAWAEALRNGFKLRWALRGLRSYFWDHCEKPDWAEPERFTSVRAYPPPTATQRLHQRSASDPYN